MDGDRTVTAQFVRYACVPNTASCTGNAFTQCDASGNFVSHVIPNGAADGSATTITMQGYACPMGCHATEPRCADIVLGNGVEVAMDTSEVSPGGRDVVLPGTNAPAGTIWLNTSMFDSAQGLIRVNDTDGSPIDLPAQLVDQGGAAGTILILKTRTFHLRAGSSLRAIGSHKLGIAAHFDIFIGGTLDARGDYDGQGYSPGAGFSDVSGCTGTASTIATGATGGGASACSGGASSTGLAGGQPPSLQAPFVLAGCGGGRTSALFSLPSPAGGGLMLASRTKLTLAAGAALDLTGSGGGGSANFAGGGAAGGNTVLFAPSIRVDAAAVVATRGGSGGAASSSGGMPGIHGPLTGTQRAAAVTCSGCGTSGAGGYEDSACGGLPGMGSGTAIAAGGGAMGWCAVYARSGGASIAASMMKCSFNSIPLQTR